MTGLTLRVLGIVCAMVPDVAVAQQIQVRAGYGAPDDAQARLAEIAEGQTLLVEPGQDPLDLARSLCGMVTHKYLEIYQVENGAGASGPSEAARTLSYPACFYIEPGGDRAKRPAESLITFAKRVIGADGPTTLKGIMALNKNLTSAALAVKVRFSTTPVLYKLKKQWGGDPQVAANYLIEAFPAASVVAADIANPRPGDLVPMTGIVARRAVPCTIQPELAPGPRAWPFDAEALVDVLKRNDTYRRSKGMAEAKSAVIAVADNGFDGLEGPDFPKTLLALNGGETPHNRKDEDRNRYVDDFLGVALYGVDDPVPAPARTIAYRQHGTMMMSLALGGAEFQAAARREGLRRISILPVGMIQARTAAVPNVGNVTTYGHPAEGLTDALLYAHRRMADVVSFSVGTTALQPGFVGYLGQPSNHLVIVAAAGNDATDYTFRTLYPASSGGQENGHVITVGAADRNGCLADFSGRAKEIVDIIAPGVAVPAVGLAGVSEALDGTSQATALVSFAVGLLKSEGYSDRIAIRDRLYATADRNPSLDGLVAAKGVLNIANAVSVHHDLVQLKAGGPFVAGQLTGTLAVDVLCDIEQAEGAQVLRAEWRAQSNDLLLLYRGKDAARSERACKPEVDAMTLEFTPEGGAPQTLRWDSLHLLIPQ